MHGCALLHTCTPLVTLEQTLAAPKSARAGHVHKTGKNRASHASRTLRGISSSVYASSPPPPPAPPSPGSGTSSGLVESPERARLSSYSVFCKAQQEQPVGAAHEEAGKQQRWAAARRRDAKPRGHPRTLPGQPAANHHCGKRTSSFFSWYLSPSHFFLSEPLLQDGAWPGAAR